MEELDFMSVIRVLQQMTLGGISVAVLVVLLTEVTKEFTGITGKATRAVAMCWGVLLSAIAYGMSEGLISESAQPYIQWVFVAIIGGLAGIGLWHYGSRFISKDESATIEGLIEKGLIEVKEDGTLGPVTDAMQKFGAAIENAGKALKP